MAECKHPAPNLIPYEYEFGQKIYDKEYNKTKSVFVRSFSPPHFDCPFNHSLPGPQHALAIHGFNIFENQPGKVKLDQVTLKVAHRSSSIFLKTLAQ